MSRTYEELLASQTELAHFNPNHDPRNGQFAKGHSGSSASSNKSKTSGKVQEKYKRDPEESKKKKEIRDLAIGGAAMIAPILVAYGAVKLREINDPEWRKIKELDLLEKTHFGMPF